MIFALRLLDLQPATATVVRGGREVTVPAEAVQRGDQMLVAFSDGSSAQVLQRAAFLEPG